MIKIKYYLTTAIPYTNGAPHIGHIYENILADFLARYHRQKGEDVFFQTGTDENGSKNYLTAKKEGVPVKTFVTRNAKKFISAFKDISSSHDNFVRTIDPEKHWPGAQKLWELMVKNKDIYTKSYKAKYCVGCEKFMLNRDIVQGQCEFHPGKKLETLEEKNYFFRLSMYQKKLIKLIESDKYGIRPLSIKKEVLSFLKGELLDISFSRDAKKLPWGVPVPNDKGQIMYVWCDALSNYITGIGFSLDRKKFKKWWPADVHIVGRDIQRFHAIYWPAMLLSAGIETPKRLWVHGFVNDVKGKKMSKSLGNVIDPFEQLKKYGLPTLRYYLLRAIPSNQDGNYSEEDLIARHNGELLNQLGNLVNRSLNLIEKNGGRVPEGKFDPKLKKKLDATYKALDKFVSNFEFHHGVSEIWSFISTVNQYVDEKKPWTLTGKPLEIVLYNLAESIRAISGLVYPIIPSKAEEIAKQLGLKSVPNFKDKSIKPGTKIKKEGYLFQRI